MTSQQLAQVGTTLRAQPPEFEEARQTKERDLEKRGHGNWPHPEPRNGSTAGGNRPTDGVFEETYSYDVEGLVFADRVVENEEPTIWQYPGTTEGTPD